MSLPVVGSRYGFATYGYRTADVGGVNSNLADFLLFLDAIGITSTHRFVELNGGIRITIRFPAVDSDLIQLGDVDKNGSNGRYRVSIQWVNQSIGTNPFFMSFADTHTPQKLN